MNDQLSRNPVLIAMSVLAGMQALTCHRMWRCGWSLGIAALQGAVQFYVRGEVTPVSDPRDEQGRPLTPDVDSTPDGYEGRHRPPADPSGYDKLHGGDTAG